MPKKHRWQNAEGRWVPYEIYEGTPKEPHNLDAYLARGYRYSEKRKEEITRKLNYEKLKRKKEEDVNRFMGALFPKFKTEFINNKNH